MDHSKGWRKEEDPVTISLSGEMSSISTIRNLSLLQRSMQQTQLRPVRAEEGETEATPPPPPATNEQMRSRIGRLSETLRELETTLDKNQTAAGALSGLRQRLLEMRDLGKTAASAEAVPEEEVAGWQQEIEQRTAEYAETRSAVRWGGQGLLDGSPGSVLNVRNVENLRFDDPDGAKRAVGQLETAIREIDHAQEQLEAGSESVYESALQSLEASSQDATATESLARDPDSASHQADYLRKVIGLHSGQAAVAQGNLASESVFLLMEA
ncbi:MAG: hypothetical protein ABIJ61_08055 [bacterium]